jgi:hypothetical protein
VKENGEADRSASLISNARQNRFRNGPRSKQGRVQTVCGRRNFVRQLFVLGEPTNKLQQDGNVARRRLSDFYSRVVQLRHAPIVADESARNQRTMSARD